MVLELVEGPGPAVVVARPPEPVAGELLGRVAGHRLLQRPLAAPLRHADRDRRAPQRAQPPLVQVGVVGLGGDQHRLRQPQRQGLAVEALDHVADQLARGQVLDLVDDEALAPRDPAPADEEDLDGGLQLVLGQPDHVEVLVALSDHLLALDGLAHALQLVAQASGPFELELRGRRPHLGVEPLDDGVGLAVEEGQQLLGQLLVGLAVDLADAGSRALLDVEEQAGPALALVVLELVVRAGPEGEGPQEQVQGLPDGVGVAERPVVAHALALRPAHHHRPRPLVAHGDGQERVALVVHQADVETGPVLLDEVELEHQRFDVVGDLDPLHRLGGGDHLRRARRQVRVRSSWTAGTAGTRPCPRR